MKITQYRAQSAKPSQRHIQQVESSLYKKTTIEEKKFNYEISDIIVYEPTEYQQKVTKNMLKNQMHRSADKVDSLRKLFIKTALKYIGTPYKKKFSFFSFYTIRYLQPDDPNYNSPLFLDCCGFIRKVVYDLRKEFGFQLAYYNQAYQFDTLPIILKHEEAKPGDLIFYSAIYYDKHHNMTHVEIYMGQTNSLGARKKRGTIQIFEDYKFKSLYYYDIKIYFKSLDS